MEIAMLLVAIAVTVLAVTAVAERLGLPAPIPLIIVGWTASYVPGVPTIHLEAEVVLLGLLPPLLYAAALSTSLVDFNANRRPILLLSVGLVVFTTVGVAVVVHTILPEVGWPAAFAIGAVVAPPDAVAATAIGRRIGLPRRIVTILEGESLLNDATALVALRTAIAATGTITAWEVGLDFAVAAGGGLAVGIVGFLLVAGLRRRVTDPLLDTGISLVVPFATYIVVGDCTDLCVYQLAMHLRLRHNARNVPDIDVVVPANAVDTYDLSPEAAREIGAMPHPGDFFHHVFLYHMALNGIRVVRELL